MEMTGADEQASQSPGIWTAVRDALTSRAVIGDPIVTDDVILVPVTRTSGATCQCGGCGKGSGGSGLMTRSRPIGAFVVNDGKVSWHPAFDFTRMILGGQVVGLAAIVAIGAWLGTRGLRRSDRS